MISTLAVRFGVVLGSGALLYGKAGGGWVDNHATITNLNTGGDQMAMAVYQQQQYVERSLAHGNGYAIGGELTLVDQQMERSE